MRKIQVLGTILGAMFALSAMLATTASAETTLLAEWLVKNEPITAELSTETSGEILLEDTKGALGGAAAVLCSGILDGTIGPNGADLITKVLNLSGVEIAESGGEALLCNGETVCGNESEVRPVGLPWKTLLFLMENGQFLDLIEGSGYKVVCLTLGNPTDTCTSTDTELLVENDAGGFVLTPENSIAEPLANCTLGGTGTGRNETEGDSTIKLVGSTESLQVSSE